jgi:phosphoglucosamine mutase
MAETKLFGTDGVRGVANVHPMTTEIAMQLGRGLAYVLRQHSQRPKILIGKDTRLSGYMIENALASGICSMGADVLLVGPMPTPGIAFITTNMRAEAGVVISASHNPFQDNGIKIFAADGFKLDDGLEAEIESLILNNHYPGFKVTAGAVGKATRLDDARGRYIVFLKQTFPQGLSLDGLKIGLDCAHGAAYKIAPAVLEELGARVTAIGVKPNGQNINKNCGSLHPERIASVVKTRGLDLGVALDGDGDRAIFVDENGNVINGDHILAICAKDLLNHKSLKRRTVVATVMSNLGLERALNQMGVRLLRTQVGDRHVVEAMRQRNLNLGGEQSGHLIFLDHNTTGDGILSTLMLLSVMLNENRSLSDLADVMEVYPQVLLNIPVKHKTPLENLSDLNRTIQAVETDMGDRGRVLIRYSGTENKLRIMVEGEDDDLIRQAADDLAQAATAELA